MIASEKISTDHSGSEPGTLRLLVRCSTNWINESDGEEQWFHHLLAFSSTLFLKHVFQMTDSEKKSTDCLTIQDLNVEQAFGLLVWSSTNWWANESEGRAGWSLWIFFTDCHGIGNWDFWLGCTGSVDTFWVEISLWPDWPPRPSQVEQVNSGRNQPLRT